MNPFRIAVADQTIDVKAKYKDTSVWCSDFITDNLPDLYVEIKEEDIAFEKECYLKEQGQGELPGSYLEFTALLRKISDQFIDRSILLMHGAAISLSGKAYIFTAPSGTGKTTHIQKWLEHCPEAVVINGDKPFLKLDNDDSVLVCGSPWAGKERMYTNTKVPLNAIIFMERAEENRIQEIGFSDAFPSLFQQIYLPDNADQKRKVIRMIQRLHGNISFYRYYCNNFKEDCFEVAYRTLC